MTTETPGAGRRFWQEFHRGRHAFRRWRRTRPFWAGLLLVLGGAQLFLSTQLSPLDVEISFGPEGFLAVLLPVVLLMCGVLLWVTPQHRYFYSVIGMVTAVYSLLGLNLGGWFLGMLLGSIGGALGLAWTPTGPAAAPGPAEPPESPSDTEAEPVPEPDERPAMNLTGPLVDEPPGPDQTAPIWAPRQEPRSYVAAMLPVLLAATLAAPQAVPSQICLPLLCPDPEPTEAPAPEPSPTGEPGPTPGPSEDPDQNPDGEDPEPEPTPEGDTSPPEPRPADASVPRVQSEPSLMTTSRLQMNTFAFEGVEELNNGTIPAMKFSFTYSESADFRLTTSGPEAETLIRADPLILRTDGEPKVIFYASRFEGQLLGTIPISLTPDSPLLAFLELVEAIEVRPNVFFTEVELDLVFTRGGRLTATGFALDVAS